MSEEACINRKINHYFLTDTLFIFLILCFVAMGGLRMSEKQLLTNLEEKDQQHEASYFDRINMIKNWLEYDRKIITPTNINDRI